MPSDSNPLAERVSSSIQQLSLVSTDLNKASDELGHAIAAIDIVLQSLSIGVPTWTTIDSGDDVPDSSHYWSRDLGYDKVGKKWGISLRDVSGDYNWPDGESCDLWLFNDAPRWLRVQAVSKIPDLLEALIKNTEETTKKIRGKTTEANQLAAVIAQAAGKNALRMPPAPIQSIVDAAKGVAAGPKPTEMIAEVARNALKETREQLHKKEKNFNTLALNAAKGLTKGKK